MKRQAMAAATAAMLVLCAAACGETPPEEGVSGGGDTGGETTVATDVLACAGAVGCACAEADTCDSGLCVQTLDGKRCAAKCEGEEGCSLVQRDAAGSVAAVCKGVRACLSGLTICVPPAGKLSCEDARCLDKKDGDSCDDGNPCTQADKCAAGACKGNNVCQCQVDKDCEAKEDGDACNGTLFCDRAQAPYKCVVSPATVVYCDPGKDTACALNSCDAKTGQCALKPQKDGQKCDDGAPCTAEDTCNAGKCTGKQVCECDPITLPCKDDGNVCNGAQFCDTSALPWTCKTNPATVITCSADDDSACKKNLCNPVDGSCAVTAVNEGGSCDDGDACTGSDTCDKGACGGTVGVCPCKVDADCKDKDDGNLCNGVPFCNAGTGQCEPNPASVITCQTVDDTACLKTSCLPKEGKCVATPAVNTLCNDGNPCTKSDECKDGKCRGGPSTCLCKTDADCKDKDDGDLCNGTLFCDKQPSGSACVINPVTKVHCQSVDDTACSANKCNAKTGTCSQQPINNTGKCDDGNPCTPSDTCVQGACASGANTCECQQDKDCADKEDGDLCNGTLYCDKSAENPGKWRCAVNPATVKACDNSNDAACARNQCDPKTGTCALGPVADNTDCGQPGGCRPKAFCISGQCEGPNVCVGCKQTADCASEEDGNKCNGTLICDTAANPPACKVDPKTVITCQADDGSGCTQWECLYKDGSCAQIIVAAKKGEPCDDGDACTEASTCQGATCKGTAKKCDDGVACTKDSCDAQKGCVHTADKGLCSDDTDCVTFTCDPQKGCAETAQKDGKACGKGICGAPGSCKAGNCEGLVTTCDDGNSCTVDSCKDGKCQHVGSGKSCKDNNPCTEDLCNDTGCLFVLNAQTMCNDGNECTEDACEQGQKCVNKATTGDCAGDMSKCKVHRCTPKGCEATDKPALGEETWSDVTGSFHAVTQIPGGFAVAGTCNKTGSTKGNDICAQLHVGGAAQPVVAVHGSVGEDEGLAMIERPEGGVAVAGRDGSNKKGWLVLFDNTGKQVGEFSHAGLGEARFRGLVEGKPGYIPLGESVAKGQSNTRAMAWPVNDGLQLTGQLDVTPPNHDVGALVGGDWVGTSTVSVCGTARTNTGKDRAFVEAVGEKGKPDWVYWVGNGSGPTVRGMACIAHNGAVVLLSALQDGGEAKTRISKVNLGGKELFSNAGPTVNNVPFMGLEVDDFGAVVVASRANGANIEGLVSRLDPSGSVAWTRAFGGAATDHLQAVTIDDVGRIIVAGEREFSGNAGKPWFLRLSPLGASSCTDGCATKSAADCDDQNPCTTDACAQGKCAHKQLADDTSCADGKPCVETATCSKGSCAVAPTKDGSSCEDGNLCTIEEACKSGTCVPSKALNCGDGNSCTATECDAKEGCRPAGPTPQGQVCNTGGCGAGKCDGNGACVNSAGTLEVFADVDGGTSDEVATVAVKVNGGFILGGDAGSGIGATGQVARISPSEKKFTKLTAVSVPAHNSVHLRAGAARKDGDKALLLGDAKTSQAQGRILVVTVGADGTPGSQLLLDVPGTGDEGLSIDRLPSGKMAILAATESGGKATHYYIEHDPSSNTFSLAPQQVQPLNGEQPGVMAVIGSQALMVSSATSNGGQKPVLRQLETGTGKSFGAAMLTSDYHVSPSAITQGSQSAILAGVVKGPATSQAWLMSANEKGALWETVLPIAAVQSITAVVGTQTGYTVAGSKTLGSGTQAVLFELDHAGQPATEMSGPLGNVAEIGGLLLSGDGFFAVGTTTEAGKGKQLWAGLLDGFGFSSCADQGKCAGKKRSDCASSNPCGLASCDADSGCKVTPRTGECLGSACKTSGSCNNGLCVGGVDRLFVKTAPGREKDDGLHAAVAHADGMMAVGYSKSFTDVEGDAWIVMTDDAGKVEMERAVGSPGKVETLRGVVKTSPNAFVAVGDVVSIDGKEQHALIVTFTSSLADKADVLTSAANASSWHAVAAMPNDKRLVLVGAEAGAKGQSAVLRVVVDGKMGAALSPTADESALSAVVATPFVTLSTGRAKGSDHDALVVATEAEGSLRWMRRYDLGGDENADAIGWMGDRAVVLVNSAGKDGSTSVRAMALSPTGLVHWDKVLASGSGYDGLDLTMTTDGFVALIHRKTKVTLESFAGDGMKLWGQDVLSPQQGPEAVVALDVGYGIVGAPEPDPSGKKFVDGVYAVVGRWGHSSCTAAGKCADQLLQNSCDPGSPCHAGVCESASGCTKEALSIDCPDNKPCTALSTCESGSCKSANPALWGTDASNGFGAGTVARAVAAYPDDTFLVAGEMPTGVFVTRLGRDGKPLWAKPIQVGAAKDDELHDATLLPSSTGVAVGTLNKGTSFEAYVMPITAAGSGVTNAAGTNAVLNAVHHAANGRLYVAGAKMTAMPKTSMVFGEIDLKTMKLAKSITIQEDNGAELSGLADGPTPDTLLAAGATGSTLKGAVCVLNEDVSLRFCSTYAQAESRFTSAVKLFDALLVGGEVQGSGARSPTVLELTVDMGKKMVQFSPPMVLSTSVGSVEVMKPNLDGWALIGGYAGSTGKEQGFVARINRSGNRSLFKQLTSGTGAAITGIAEDYGSNLVLGGSDSGKSWVSKIDKFGNTSCAASGSCVDQSLNQCSQGPCTNATCSQGQCKPETVPDGTACGPQQSCKGGQCL